MTKDAYFEMCEMLGTSPKDEEIPVEYEDLPDEVQEAIVVYNMLQDNWDTMNGGYLGKVVSGINDIFNIAQVEDKQTCFNVIQILDNIRAKIINNKKPAK
jgi:hypothetical protein